MLYIFPYPSMHNVIMVITTLFKNFFHFTRRQRNYQAGQSPYMALLETVKMEDSQMSLELVNTKTKVQMKLVVSGLDGNMVRLRITESHPVNPRYEPPIGDVLVEEPKLQK